MHMAFISLSSLGSEYLAVLVICNLDVFSVMTPEPQKGRMSHGSYFVFIVFVFVLDWEG